MIAVAVCGLSAAPGYGQPIRFTSQTELGILLGGGPFAAQHGFTGQTFNGVRLNEFAAVGATVGIDAYRQITLLPLAIGWRGIVPMGGVSPYLGLDAGYGFAWLNDDTDTEWKEGGLMVNPVVGIRIQSNGNDRFTLAVGYKRQTYSTFEGQPMMGSATVAPQPDSSLPPGLFSLRQDKYLFQRVSIRVGVVF